MKFYAKHVSVGEFDNQYFQASFDSEPPSEDAFDLSRPDHPYLIVQRQFEDDDGGVCYIETHDHDAYAGHFPLQLIEFTPTRLFFEIARAKDKLSVCLSVVLIATYGLGLVFSLKTHREFFGGAEHTETGDAPWPLGLALATLAGVTVLVA